MMKKIALMFIVGLTLVLVTCTARPKVEKETLSPLERAKSKDRSNFDIPDSVLSFFPDSSEKYKELDLLMTSENVEKSDVSLLLSEFSPAIVVETYLCQNEEILKSLKNKYLDQSLEKIKSESKTYFVIGSERELLKKHSALGLMDIYKNYKSIPFIISFQEVYNYTNLTSLYDSTTICGLHAGYTILILKSGNEFILPKKYSYDWEILPDAIKSGYRSGVAFKEGAPYIIYWLVAW